MGLLSKLPRPKRGLERAEALYSKGRHADAAAALRSLAAEKDDMQAQWRLGQLYERGEGAKAFERTASRLEEMQSKDYLELPHLT